MITSVMFGSELIEFRLVRSDRKSLGISVMPNLDVIVKAPIEAKDERIAAVVKRKGAWIIKQRLFFESFQPRTPIRKYISGETHLYLGRQYRLQVEIGNVESVKLKGKFIWVIARNKSRVEELVQSWYVQKAKIRIGEIAEPLVERFKRYKVQPQTIVFRAMATRWGSCTPKGRIILNPELIKAPKPCIEYVIIHELCHLVHYDHTKKFMQLQTREMRDWEKWKQKLEVLLA